jgi:membrane associated rhomboid family serine protease
MSQGILRRPLPYRFFNATVFLIGANLAVFLLTMVVDGATSSLALIPILVVRYGYWWQVVTYMFVHGGYLHILLNMFALFLFGVQLERRMGSIEFLLYYFVCGIGVGLLTLLINYYTGLQNVAVVGASGAIYGLLLAYAVFFPDSRIFVFGLLPLRAPVAVFVFAGLELFFQFTGLVSGVAHLAHLSGLLIAYFYILVRYGINPIRVFFRR